MPYRKKIDGNGDGTMFFQDIRRNVDNSGARNRGWSDTLGFPFKQFGKGTVNSNAATDISSSNRIVGVVVGLE